MVSKILGYAVTFAGLVVLALGVKPVNSAISEVIPFFSSISQSYFLVAGLLVAAAGVVVLKFASPGQPKEVPIYHGKKVVGYRRMK